MARAGELGVDQALTFLTRGRRDQHAPPRADGRPGPRAAATARSPAQRVAVLGAAFKPDSDDIRDSPALDVAARIQLQGAHGQRLRPAGAWTTPARAIPTSPTPTRRVEAAAGRRHRAAPDRVARVPRDGPGRARPTSSPERNIVDGRNALDPERWRARRLDLPRARPAVARGRTGRAGHIGRQDGLGTPASTVSPIGAFKIAPFGADIWDWEATKGASDGQTNRDLPPERGRGGHRP